MIWVVKRQFISNNWPVLLDDFRLSIEYLIFHAFDVNRHQSEVRGTDIGTD